MKVLIKNPDGSVGILHPVLGCGLTIEQIIEKDVPKVLVGMDGFGNATYEQLSYEIVDDSAIPADRTFRNAWKHDLTVDITKAHEITKERLRKDRQPLLEKLDVEVMKNIADPVKIAEIESQKQVLRDITKVVDTLTTVDELKAVKCQ